VLAVTPLRVISKWNALARYRRMLGLFAYFYVVMHLLCYSWFDMGFEWGDIAKDIAKRPFILVGFSAFVLLTPLAATSFNRAIKAMGAKRWQMLHKLVYLIAGLGLLHFFWMRAGKNNFAEVFVYVAIIAVLLAGACGTSRASKKKLQPAYGARGEKPLRSTLTAFSRRSLLRSWSSIVSRRRIRWRLAPLTSTSAARPRVL
jgi:sulfoxide reductase heme-binding subunit YedZ